MAPTHAGRLLPVHSRPGTTRDGVASKLQAATETAVEQARAEIKAARAQQPPDRKSLAVSLITEGRPRAFVDFFLLTHDPPAAQPGQPGQPGVGTATDTAAGTSGGELLPEGLVLVRQQVVCADSAGAAGDTAGLLEAHRTLGRYFSELGQLDKAVYFYDQALQAARAGGWAEAELEASATLGLLHEAMAQPQLAVACHERSLILASTAGRPEDADAACHSLVAAYAQQAERAQRDGDGAAAAALLAKCLRAAQRCGDAVAAGEVNHRLGRMARAEGRWRDALAYEQAYLALARQTQDHTAEGVAACACAECQAQLGDAAGAAATLEGYLQAARGQDVRGQALASFQLGALRFAGGAAQAAVVCFERAYELARSLGDRRLLDAARINLGVARGSAQLAAYARAAHSGLEDLLRWKSVRMPLPGSAR